MVNYKSKYLAMKLKYINKKHMIMGGVKFADADMDSPKNTLQRQPTPHSSQSLEPFSSPENSPRSSRTSSGNSPITSPREMRGHRAWNMLKNINIKNKLREAMKAQSEEAAAPAPAEE